MCPAMEKDRVMYGDFAKVADIIAKGQIAASLV